MDACEYADDQLVALLRETEEQMRVLMSEQLAVIAEAERRGLFSEHGARNTKAWLQSLLRLSPGDADSRVKVARKVEDRRALTGEALPPDQPETADALAEGAIGLEHARAITDGIAKLPPRATPQERADAEAFLTSNARVLQPGQVRVLAERIRYQLEQDGALREEQYQIDNRELHIATGRDSMTVLKGRIDREAGARLRAALDPLARPRPSKDGDPDPRSANKRNADALVEVLDLALASGEVPTSGGEPPHVAVTIGLSELQEAFGSGVLESTGEPLSASTARRMACDAKVIPIVLGTSSEPLDVARESYVVPRHLRKALHARDGTCAFPGCDHPPGTSQAHHCQHWADGGTTSLDNLVMLCAAHHRMLHAQNWQARITHGRPEFIPPYWKDPRRRPLPGGRPLHQHQLALATHARG